MSYGQAVIDQAQAVYTANFAHDNGTWVQLTFIDPIGNGVGPTTDDDFQSALDAIATTNGWTFQRGMKQVPTVQIVTAS